MVRYRQPGSLIPTPKQSRQVHAATFNFLSETSKRILERGLLDGPPTTREFEKAARCGLNGSELYTPGADVKVWGGTPVFDAACSKAPHRRQVYLHMLRILHAATGVWQATFLMRVLGPLAMWIQDLPASESYHHAYWYGLLDHALEVALASLTECGLRIWPRDLADLGNPALPGQVLRLSIALGLLHDIGKVFGVEVRDEKSGEVWDPLREPLAYFKLRKGIPLFTPTRFRFLNHRGLNHHEAQGRSLLQSLLPKRTRKQIGSPLATAYDCYLERFEPKQIERPAPFDWLAYIVQQADGESARRARREGWSAESRFQELMAAAAEVPWKTALPATPLQSSDSTEDPDSVRESEATC